MFPGEGRGAGIRWALLGTELQHVDGWNSRPNLLTGAT